MGEIKDGGMGHDALGHDLKDAKVLKKEQKKKAKSLTYKGKNPRKVGGQKNNQNARKGGIYSRLEGFDDRFHGFTVALSRIDAREEVALSRAMLSNVLMGKMPLGEGHIEDGEYQAELARDVMMLNLKAQEIALKQTVKREEMELKKAGNKGLVIEFANEFEDAVNGKVEQDEEPLSTDADVVLAAAKAALDEARKQRDHCGGEGNA